jgi:hypothetical protein
MAICFCGLLEVSSFYYSGLDLIRAIFEKGRSCARGESTQIDYGKDEGKRRDSGQALTLSPDFKP